jgi:hypothetical protein
MSRRSIQPASATLAGLIAAAGMTAPLPSQAANAPSLWGYGVKPCSDYLAVAPGDGAPAEVASPEYARYREWLAGLVTGLNLATGNDVLGGAELEAALTRVRARCKTHPSEDFFNASMVLIRSLGTIKGTKDKPKKD